MNQLCDQVPPIALPDWFVAADKATRHAYGCVRKVDVEVRDALDIDRLDPRLRSELRAVLDALNALKGSLAFFDMTAGEVLKELRLRQRNPSDSRANADGSPVPAESRGRYGAWNNNRT